MDDLKLTINHRGMAASDLTNTKKDIKLSPAAWITYAWLLQHSKYNCNGNEDHYYIYYNAFSTADIAKDTKYCESSITKARSELLKTHLMYKDKMGGKTVLIFPFKHTDYAIAFIDISLLQLFLSFQGYEYKDLLIQIFGVLIAARRAGVDEFSISSLASVMHRKIPDSKLDILTCLALLEHLELLKLNKFTYHYMGKDCIKYKIISIKNSARGLDKYFNDDESLTVALTAALKRSHKLLNEPGVDFAAAF